MSKRFSPSGPVSIFLFTIQLTRDCVTSLLECFGHVTRCAVHLTLGDLVSWLEGAPVSAQSCIGFFTYWIVVQYLPVTK